MNSEQILTERDATVFVVDDNSHARRGLCRLFEKQGWRVEGFESGEEFLDSYDGNRCGCLILDLNLPGMTGLDVQKKLGKYDCRLPIIVLTGAAGLDSALQAFREGVLDFLCKPVEPKYLFDLIRRGVDLDLTRRNSFNFNVEVAKHFDTLSEGERSVLDALILGHPNKRIALDLSISRRTVEDRRAKLMRKMRAGSLAELVETMTRFRVSLPPSR